MAKLKATLFLLLFSLFYTNLNSQNNSEFEMMLKQREVSIDKNESTKEIDLQLSRLYAYSPKVVLKSSKNKTSYFEIYLPIKETALISFQNRLRHSFKISDVVIDLTSKKCEVEFKPEANETDRIEFFKAFGYDGIIYK